MATLHRLQAHRCRRRSSGSALSSTCRSCHSDLGASSHRGDRRQNIGRLTRRFDSMTNRRSRATREMPETVDLDPVLDFMRLLWSVEHGLQSTSKRMEATLGITGPQRLVLRIVTARPGLSAGELARIVHLHPSARSRESSSDSTRKGLLRRERDRRDSRRIRLHSQAAASGFVAASTGTVESAVTRALVRIPRHRVRHAREVLAAIAEALADDRGKSAAASRRQTRKSTEERRFDQPRAGVSQRNREPASQLRKSSSTARTTAKH